MKENELQTEGKYLSVNDKKGGKREIVYLGETPGFKARKGKYKMSLEHLIVPSKYYSSKHDRDMSKDYRSIQKCSNWSNMSIERKT